MLDRKQATESIHQRRGGNEHGQSGKRIGFLGAPDAINERGFEMWMKPAGDNAEHQEP